jgi:type IX secretion system PorP/SprF family membrane protein
LYNKNYWLGAAVHHLNQPNRSLLNESALLPVRTTLHGGARFPLYHGPFKEKREAAIAPSFVYKHQDRFSQLDIGAYLLYEPIVFGLWYRGIPVKENAADNMSRDAMVVILGFQFERFEFSYSYDFTVSELGPISGGAHELALKYKIAIQTRAPHKKREKFIPCPASIRR